MACMAVTLLVICCLLDDDGSVLDICEVLATCDCVGLDWRCLMVSFLNDALMGLFVGFDGRCDYGPVWMGNC